MKKKGLIVLGICCILLVLLLVACTLFRMSGNFASQEEDESMMSAKPVIYLYPEESMEVSVKLSYDGELTCTYPEYGNGWRVLARPDGTLVDLATRKEYSYLFWEGLTDVRYNMNTWRGIFEPSVSNTLWYDMSRGYVVKGEDTAEFLQDILARMGLTPRVYNEFIVYWLPKMQENPYNLITFQTDAYTEHARLAISPEPDSLLRVFMAYQALEEPVEVEEPEVRPFLRDGFTVIEWGGTKVR